MKSFRFAVISDTHYCTLAGRRHMLAASDFTNMPDYLRYAPMVQSVLTPLSRRIAGENVDFLISTGDLIEGGADSIRDDREARTLFSRSASKFYLAPGTHDRNPLPGEKTYFSFRHHDCCFIILDYRCWNTEQLNWLLKELKHSKNASHLFVFAHPPLYLWGRHFFDSPHFTSEVRQLLADYPVDVYFCGHTHNQTASFHHGMLQITGSTVGSASGEPHDLTNYHFIPDRGPDHRFFWGIVEDSAPGYWIVEVNNGSLTMNWHSFTSSAKLHIATRRHEPTLIIPPCFQTVEHSLTESDRFQVRTGWLDIFSSIRTNNNSELILNGISLGPIPENQTYAARRFITLSTEALRTLRNSNSLDIKFPDTDTFAIGSISVKLLLMDGRIIYTPVAPELFYAGNSPDYHSAINYAEKVLSGTRRQITLDFRPESTGKSQITPIAQQVIYSL